MSIFNRRKREIERLKAEMAHLQKDYNSLMTESQNMVEELNNENDSLRNGTDTLLEKVIDLKSELKIHKINNLPEHPCEVNIEFYIGAKKQVYFDGKNFIKADNTPYRLASIKLWREI